MVRFAVAFAAVLVGVIASASADAQTLQTEMVYVDADTALATDVWLPAGDMPDGGWPVVLRRTPYGRGVQESDAAGFSSLGYVYVTQDVRGRGASGGSFLPFLTDASDGRAAIEWAATQPWSNGRVCTYGGSAEGIVQLMAAGEGPAGLVGMIPFVATDDIYEGLMGNGVWRQEMTTAWLNDLVAPDVLAEWRANEADGPYWDRGRLTPEKRAGIDFPVFHIGGFFDIFAHSQLRMHRDMQDQVAPGSRADQFIVMGPFTHGGMVFAEGAPVMEGEVEYVRGASYDLVWLDILDFMEWTLLQGERPAWAPIRYFRSRLSDDGFHATGFWRTADRWPPAGRQVVLSTTPARRLTPGLPPFEPSWIEIPVNPLDPVPSRGGGNLSTPAGIFDQKEVDTRQDVMWLQTDPVASDTLVEGDVSARLRVIFSGSDGDVIVRLSQVTPEGAVMLLADGAVRGRFLADPATAAQVVPGKAYDVEIGLGPVAVELPSGHSLRLSVAGTSSPRYEPNPGYFVPLSSEDIVPVSGTLKVAAGFGGIIVNVTGGDQWSPVIAEPSDDDVATVADTAAIDDLSCESDTTPCDCPAAGCSGGRAAPLTVAVMLAVAVFLFLTRRRDLGTRPGKTSE